MRETKVAVDVRLGVQSLGTTLFRNTVGRFQVLDNYGLPRWLQVGLCVGSSDYIGFTEYIIKPEDVGRKVAIFTAIETKNSSGGKKSDEQKNFVARVQQAGGIAFFANGVSVAREAILRWTRNSSLHSQENVIKD